MPTETRLCDGALVMSWPSNTTEPAVTGRTPDIVFIVVVFPAPFAPIRVTISPWLTSKEIPLIAWMRP